jgi:predicted nucleotidyltransferase
MRPPPPAMIDCSGVFAVTRLRPRTQDLEAARGVALGLAQALGPRLQRVLLFGSRARGDVIAESDLDLLILVDRRDRAVRDAIEEATWPLYPLFVDVQVFTPARWEWALSADAPLLRHALEEGVELWPPSATGAP